MWGGAKSIDRCRLAVAPPPSHYMEAHIERPPLPLASLARALLLREKKKASLKQGRWVGWLGEKPPSL